MERYWNCDDRSFHLIYTPIFAHVHSHIHTHRWGTKHEPYHNYYRESPTTSVPHLVLTSPINMAATHSQSPFSETFQPLINACKVYHLLTKHFFFKFLKTFLFPVTFPSIWSFKGCAWDTINFLPSLCETWYNVGGCQSDEGRITMASALRDHPDLNVNATFVSLISKNCHFLS